jgi:sulfonate transport system substrate-binding protein
LPEPVVERALGSRTDLSNSAIGEPQRQSILVAGLALQQAGVIPAGADVKAAVDSLIDSHYVTASK